jgi:DtxR family transcriptional regulator, Mn-dependent transcriptional regulator
MHATPRSAFGPAAASFCRPPNCGRYGSGVVNALSRTAVEDYLKVIFNLAEWDAEDAVSNADVAALLGVSTSSASEMVRKLTADGLLEHERYGGIALSSAGRRQAMTMVRRHRLVETFLVEMLGYSWDEVHDEAEVLEHAVSDLLVQRMDVALGHPFRDPHGDPIPTVDGRLHRPQASMLAALDPGDAGWIARIIDDNSDLLRWFADNDISLDTAIEVIEQRPFGGALVVRVGSGSATREVELGLEAATALWIARVQPVAERRPAGCPYPECDHGGRG